MKPLLALAMLAALAGCAAPAALAPHDDVTAATPIGQAMQAPAAGYGKKPD